MHVSRALLKNTRASLHFHKRFFIFSVALLVVVVALVAVCSGLPQVITAGDTSGKPVGGVSRPSSFFYVFNTHTEPTATPSSSPSASPTFTPHDPTPSPPPTVTPEFGVGGAVIALFACFVAFTLFMRYGKTRQVSVDVVA